MIFDFSLKKGKITFNDFPIRDNLCISSQIDELKEDMIQVEFPDGYLLDIGWRPSFDIKGKFHIYLIKDYDWENPVYKGSAKELDALQVEIKNAIDKI